ncbi:MAG: hypothetical protein R3C16_08855 [Hyphomonadaceae bacterium]
MHRVLGLLAAIALLGLAAPAAAQDLAVRAQSAAADLNAVCSEDNGRLWGVSLCGPLLVVDPATREVWANQADAQGNLSPSGAGWRGVLAPETMIANTSVTWSGVRWIMLIHVPEDATERRVLVAHEAWHRIQARLGLPQQPSDCAHLASERGRYWLRLEMRALASALRSSGLGRSRAVTDALMLRAARLAEFPGAAAQEAALDRNEGLAAYTGVALGAERPNAYAAATLDRFDSHQAFTRAYAYATGPAYGLLLDQDRRSGPWRANLGEAAPADALAQVARVPWDDAARLASAVERYGGAAVAAEERERAVAEASRIAALRARYSGPRLVLPLSAQASSSFNPNQITPLAELGRHFGVYEAQDVWGVLTAETGALVAADYSQLTVAEPGPDGLSGPGWRLRLAPGYRITEPDPSGRRGIEQILPPAP